MTASFDKLISVATYLERLGIEPTKQACHNTRRNLRAARVPDFREGRHVFYRPEDLVAYMQRHRQPHGVRKSA